MSYSANNSVSRFFHSVLTARGMRWLVFLILAVANHPAPAAVVVVNNRADNPTTLLIEETADSPARRVAIRPGQVVPIPAIGPIEVRTAGAGQSSQYRLSPNSVYFIGQAADGQINLHEIGFAKAPTAAAAPTTEVPVTEPAVPNEADLEDLGRLGRIRVKLMVDDDEPTVRKVWEARLRKRLAAASEILAQHCFMALEVVAVDTWHSDNRITDFEQTLREFEATTQPDPAQLVIGFTSQYDVRQRRTRLGVTRLPLHSHILVRERGPRNSEAERLEVLVHELGHYFGSAHSPEVGSVMRPNLNDGRVLARDFVIRFDPVNTLAMCLVSEEVRLRGARSLGQLSQPTRQHLRSIYAALAEALPSDPAAKQFVAVIDRSLVPPALEGARGIVRAIAEAAAAQERGEGPPADTEFGPSGDALAEFYIRRAAQAALEMPEEHAANAFLLTLGITLDRSQILCKTPPFAELCKALESPQDRERRAKQMGRPTAHARSDLLAHFVVSAAMTSVAKAEAVEAAGTLKEVADSQGGTGFSFADLAANLAGIRFAQALKSGDVSLKQVAEQFRIADFLPEVNELAEGLSAEDLTAEYGSTRDPRYLAEISRIRARIDRLGGYQP